MEQDVIDDVIIKVEERFPVLTVKKGNVHTLLGMKIMYLNNSRIVIIHNRVSTRVQGECFPVGDVTGGKVSVHSGKN